MRRFQLFEFTDLDSWPEPFRALLTDHLRTLLEIAKPFNGKASAVAEALRRGKTRKVVDLCSGSGGPWSHFKKEVERELGEEISVLLTDKYPNTKAAERLRSLEGFEYLSGVDALDVSASLDGIRTVIDGFHHFTPEQAQGILADAVSKKRPIIVLECIQRTWIDFVLTAISPLLVLLLAPFVKPFRFTRLIFTYLVPIAPLVVTWDAAVSVLRCYTPAELLGMARAVSGDGYEWEAGAARNKGTWLVGWPIDAASGT